MPNIINKQLFIVDTSMARPISFQILRGETVQITCRFRDHLDPIVVAGMTATAYWHSGEMAPTSWYSSNAVTLESDKAVWNWVPDFGADGAKEYEWYIKVTDSATNISYRAFGSIQMVGSPDSDPGEAPEAQSNYYTKEETDAAIEAAIGDDAVTSVNGQTGAVVLTASDVGGVTQSQMDTAISTATQDLVHNDLEINGHALTGDVNLTASDVGAVTQSQMNAAISTATEHLVHDDLEINGHSLTQDIELTASDVEAIPESDRPDFEPSHDLTYITDTDDETYAYDWSGTLTLAMLEDEDWTHDTIKSVRIGNKITGIGTSAFNFQSNLVSVDFGEGLQTIGQEAFFNDYRLPSLVFPPSLQSIGRNAFANCNAVSYCLFEQKTEAQVKAMPDYGNWGILAPLTVASQQWVDSRIDNLDASDVGAVPTGRTINNKSLSQNVTLTASDVGALPASNGTVSTDASFAGRLEKRTGEFFASLDVDSIEYGRDNQADNYLYFPEDDGTIATEEYVAEQITQGTAIYRGSFATKAALNAVQWQTSNPSGANFVSNNDYAVVQADESQDGGCWRYIYVIDTAQSISRWEAQYEINESPLTQAQLDALNSTATKAKIDSIADKVPQTRTVNSKALSADVTLTASDVGAATVADATLTDHFEFGSWTSYWRPPVNNFRVTGFEYDNTLSTPQWVILYSYAPWPYDTLDNYRENTGVVDKGATSIEMEASVGIEVTATRTKTAFGYQLGNQDDKPLAGIADIPTAYASNPEMDGTASAGSSTAYAKGDHVHPTDTSRASVNDAHLNYVASVWTITPATYNDKPISIVGNSVDYNWTPYCDGVAIGEPKGNEASASLSWDAEQEEAAIDISATRTIYDGYRLGSQNTKILASQTQMTNHVNDKTIHTNGASIAAEFDATESYAVDDYVMYQGSLYKCVVAHDAGSWDGQDFTAVAVTDEMGSGGGGASIVETTWSALKALRDGGTLVPGTMYRITDYVCTTTQLFTSAASNLFDIIVEAVAPDRLSEEASAEHHSGDSYFANSKLEAWKLWYCLDNDTTRFGWADATNGKGVVYRMIDEFVNDLPYDFKNIKVQIIGVANSDYTFRNNGKDGSLLATTSLNCIEEVTSSGIRRIPMCIFAGTANSNKICRGCSNIYFGSTCSYNYIGAGTTNVTLDVSSSWNIIEGRANQIKLGRNCYSNKIGLGASYVTFGNSSFARDYYSNITVESGNQYIYLDNANSSSSSKYQNVTIAKGVNNTSTYLTITDTNVNQAYQTTFYNDTTGTLVKQVGGPPSNAITGDFSDWTVKGLPAGATNVTVTTFETGLGDPVWEIDFTYNSIPRQAISSDDNPNSTYFTAEAEIGEGDYITLEAYRYVKKYVGGQTSASEALAPAGAYVTRDDMDSSIGDINAILDTINGQSL